MSSAFTSQVANRDEPIGSEINSVPYNLEFFSEILCSTLHVEWMVNMFPVMVLHSVQGGSC